MHPSLRALGATSFLAFLAAVPLSAQTAAQRIAYVNTQRIIERAPARPDAEAQLQREFVVMQAEVKRMEDSLKVMIDAFQRQEATMTTAAREQRGRTITAKQNEYGQRTQDLQDRAEQRRNELMQPILDQIKIVLEDLRVEGNYTMIFDVGQGGAIVAADKNLDLSDRAIAKLGTMPKPVVEGPRTAPTRADPTRAVGAPISAPAGVRPPGAAAPGANPPAAAPAPTRQPDSVATKAADTTKKAAADSTKKATDSTKKAADSTKKPADSVTKRPPTLRGDSPSGA